MSGAVSPVPAGFNTVSAHLVIRGAAAAIEFYQKAFGAEVKGMMPSPDGRVMHAEMRIGDSMIMLNDEFPEMGAQSPSALGGSPVTMHIYVADCDALWNRAVAAGATVRMPLADMFWGDRYGVLADPFGHHWSIGTHKEDLTAEEVGQRAAEAMKQMPPKA
ncbi:MAG: VOC family protein [bacterium]